MEQDPQYCRFHLDDTRNRSKTGVFHFESLRHDLDRYWRSIYSVLYFFFLYHYGMGFRHNHSALSSTIGASCIK
jgi:hypothetical protein